MTIAAGSEAPLVLVVDDDVTICEALADLLRSVGIESRCFASARALLEAALPDRPGALVLDVRLPGLSGLDFQEELARRGNAMPIIFMTGHGDIPMTVRAMKAGAVDFLTKPFRDQDMLDAVTAAIDRDGARRRMAAEDRQVAELAAALTPREREVLAAVRRGLLNKQIAHELGISEITVKLHRGNLRRKMGARSLADLLQKTQRLA
jgi:FixJ family two-component response regulator